MCGLFLLWMISSPNKNWWKKNSHWNRKREKKSGKIVLKFIEFENNWIETECDVKFMHSYHFVCVYLLKIDSWFVFTWVRVALYAFFFACITNSSNPIEMDRVSSLRIDFLYTKTFFSIIIICMRLIFFRCFSARNYVVMYTLNINIFSFLFVSFQFFYFVFVHQCCVAYRRWTTRRMHTLW